MRLRSERASFLVVFLALPAIGGPAAAEGPPPLPAAVARLEVQASPDCATREELVSRVASRSRRIRFPGDAAGGPLLRATIGPGPGGTIVGDLVVLRPGGRRSSRRLSAPSCAEAIDAIALVIAMTLDPTFAADAAATGAATAAEAPADIGARTVSREQRPAGPAPPPTAPPPTAPPSTASPPTAPPSPIDVPVAAESAPPAGQGESRRFGAGVTAQAIWGVAPRALPGFGLYGLAGLDRASIWSPALLLWATHSSTDDLAEPGGTAAFALDAVSLDACPFRLALPHLEARGCATGLVGRLSARGSDTYSPASRSRPFGTFGASALLTVTLSGIVELSGRFGAGASLVRDAFEFTPQVFHRVASVTLVGDLGLGLRFP